MLISTCVAHRKYLLLGRHEQETRLAGLVWLWLLLLLSLWLTCVCANKFGHEPFYGQHVARLLFFLQGKPRAGTFLLACISRRPSLNIGIWGSPQFWTWEGWFSSFHLHVVHSVQLCLSIVVFTYSESFVMFSINSAMVPGIVIVRLDSINLCFEYTILFFGSIFCLHRRSK